MLRAARPFLIALLPLIVGLGVYYIYWQGKAARYAADIAAETGQQVPVTGFPYRLSADLPSLDLSAGGDALAANLSTGLAELTRGPFRPDLVVGRVRSPRLELGSKGLGLGALTAGAPYADVSLRTGDGVIHRLSVVAPSAGIDAPLLGGAATASDLQVHFRETPTETPRADAGQSPVPPGQADIRLSGLIDWPEGRRARIVLPVQITADAPLESVAAWQSSGTLEVAGGEIAGGDGEPVATFDATLAALGDRLALSGTLESDCPRTVAALFGGGGPLGEPEYRRRKPARFVLGGTADAPTLSERPTPSGGLARNREPPCPVLHR